MSNLSRRKLLGLFGMAPLAGGVAAAAGTTPFTSGGQNLSDQARQRIHERNLPNIPLITHEGKRVFFYDDLVKDKVVSLNFFFAKCEEVCPLVMANLAKVQKLLGSRGCRERGPQEDKVVKSILLKSALVCVCIVAMAGLLPAQTLTTDTAGGITNFVRFNPPPCDFNDTFYKENGVDPTKLVLRFGSARQFGPPSTVSTQPNWVADSTCSVNDPTTRNFRILAATGGFKFDDGSPVLFISILAFLTNQNTFETSFSKTVGGSTISISKGQNPRGIAMQDIVSNFE